MQEVSQLFEQIYRSGAYYMKSRISIEAVRTGSGQFLVYPESQIISMKRTGRVFNDNFPMVGCCPCGELYLDIIKPDIEIPRMACLIPSVQLVSTENGNESEWINKGKYYIDTRDVTNNSDGLDIVSLHAYDGMMKAEKEYAEYFIEIDFVLSSWTKSDNSYITEFSDERINSNYSVTIMYTDENSIEFSSHITTTVLGNVVKFTSNALPPSNIYGKVVLRKANTLAFPATDLNVIVDIASKMGVEINPDTVAFDGTTPEIAENQPIFNKEYVIQYPSEYTLKETLGYIASMYGGNFVMDDNGRLTFIGLCSLEKETGLLIEEHGYRLVFGEGEEEERRILIVGEGQI